MRFTGGLTGTWCILGAFDGEGLLERVESIMGAILDHARRRTNGFTEFGAKVKVAKTGAPIYPPRNENFETFRPAMEKFGSLPWARYVRFQTHALFFFPPTTVPNRHHIRSLTDLVEEAGGSGCCKKRLWPLSTLQC
jgi:hypothetical protein